ncbi:Cytochrome P450 [Colletotrichum higginsianum IMI 349063]|uniref:Cytochrome P450 n=3 Tax=Colletotrichum higginsianum TaxID=80884 RepID=A0A1B7YRC1_COLHI|nr:Cytochrome P450 [Colletotrichum higginsianum IMI 349063]OBR14494.1 Cytochrome P450 [Colletotrichum higginsianum IMI 349063]TID01386.1 Isotrichodermin C-15 hydroxylase [Colletotrichum higginsianum]
MIIPQDISTFGNVRLAVALPIVLLGLICIRLISRVVYNVYFHPLRHYPGPKAYAATRIPLTRMITSGKAHKKIAELHAQYGPVVRLGPDTIDWADPRAFKDLMGHSKGGGGGGENYRDPINAQYRPHSIINANREDHARIRRVLAHGFSAQSMVDQQPLIQTQIDLLIQRLHENCEDGGKALNMVAWFNYTTFDIIGDLAFGEPFGCLEKSDYHPWVSSIFDNIHASVYRNQFQRYSITRPFARWLVPKKLKESQGFHNQLSMDKVRRRMALGESRPDFVQSMMLKEGSLAMSKPEIEQTADLLIIAGSETTASVLSGVTFFLTTHPDAMAKLAEEVRTSFASEQEIDVLSVQKLRYMLAVLDESMRVYPVVPIGLTRVVKPGGDYVCEKFVPEGTRVMVSQWPMYHNDEQFAQADSFIPERWLGDPRFENDNKGALQPFSFGPRNCIGRNLAMSEMRVILARVIWNFEMQIADDSRDWTEQELFGLWKKGPLNIHLKPREK